jgi:hypothetical protein
MWRIYEQATDLRRTAGMYKRMAAVPTSGGHEADHQLLALAAKLDHEAARLEGQNEPRPKATVIPLRR